MLIGYARVSMHDQNMDLQKDALKEAGCKRIFADQASGAKSDRPGLDRALETLREGDTLVVWRLDRLGRSLKHLITLAGELEEGQIGLKSLQESIDTTTTGGKLIFHVFGAMAEFERNIMQERTRAGLIAARARGRSSGRPKALDPQRRELAVKLYVDRVHSVKKICRIMGVSKPTLYCYLREAGAKIGSSE